MMEESTRKAILASVVASVLVIILVEPILSVSWKGVVWVGENLYSGVTNYFISQIASGSVSFLPILIGSILVVLGASPLLFSVMVFRKRGILAKSIQAKQYRLIMLILSVMLALLCWFMGLLMHAQYVYNTRFNQYVHIVAPYVSNEDILFLKSRWASMEKLEDFKNMDNELTKLFLENNLNKPSWLK